MAVSKTASVATSTIEADIVAASEAVRKLIWLKRLYERISSLKDISQLMIHNEAAIGS